MPIEQVEQKKKKYTDKYVVVDGQLPELRRFSGLTGIVKTVNMSGRALVEFDGPVDIGWYDIDLTYLTVVDAPVKGKSAAEKSVAEKSTAPPTIKTDSKPATVKPKGALSPLELARQQGAVKTEKQTKGTSVKKTDEPKQDKKKRSPLELARQQGAFQGGEPKDATKAEKEATEQNTSSESESQAESLADKPAQQKIPTTGPDGKPLSKLALARRQGPFKS